MSMCDQTMSAVPVNGAVGEAAVRDWAGVPAARARSEGVELTGADGLSAGLVCQVLLTGSEVGTAGHPRASPGSPGRVGCAARCCVSGCVSSILSRWSVVVDGRETKDGSN